MTKQITHKFVETIPDFLEENVIYISVEYTAVVHKCFCGCGNEVNTPLTPTDWKITYDGNSISLYPSVGSWNLDCKSHYWIKDSQVHWAKKWSKEEIDFANKKDVNAKNNYYGQSKDSTDLFGKGIFTKIKKWMNWLE
ncbi:MAG: DUF6527 family protein [Pseudobdellovibrio sp.]